jgi:hypothetical protein
MQRLLHVVMAHAMGVVKHLPPGRMNRRSWQTTMPSTMAHAGSAAPDSISWRLAMISDTVAVSWRN